MISVTSLEKTYGQRKVVDGVSLAIDRGEIIGLLGPNGAGKTTTFYMTVGLVRPDHGTVYLNGHDVTRMAMHKRARLGLGYLPQEPSVFKKLTVQDNIFMIWELLDTIPRVEYEPELTRLLGDMDLLHLRHTLGISLSGGERRRVEIVRALAVRPMFMLLDEPFAGIDPIAVADIQLIIQKLKAQNLGILITDHNVRETLSITDRATIIHNGRVLLSGSSQDIAENPIAKALYLGEQFSL